jgi:hypothetical protein
MENWCHPCQQEGKPVVAKFTVEGRPYCAAHYMAWRKEHPGEAAPAAAPIGTPLPSTRVELQPLSETSNYEIVEKPMKQKLDYAAMQKDRDVGMSLAEIAKKYDCSYASVCANTNRGSAPARPRGPYKKPARLEALADAAQDRVTPQMSAHFSDHATIAELLAKLRARQAALNEAIEAVEMAQKVLARSEELA